MNKQQKTQFLLIFTLLIQISTQNGCDFVGEQDFSQTQERNLNLQRICTLDTPINFISKYEISIDTSQQQFTQIVSVKVVIQPNVYNLLNDSDYFILNMRIDEYTPTVNNSRNLGFVVTQSPYDNKDDLLLDLSDDMKRLPANNYIDYTAFSSGKPNHFLKINLKEFIFNRSRVDDFVFYVQCIDTGFNFQSYNIIYDINIYKYNSVPCPYDCNGRGECNKGICDCSQGYFDTDCTLTAQFIPNNKKVQAALQPNNWNYFYYGLSNIKHDIQIEFAQSQQDIRFHLFYYGDFITSRPVKQHSLPLSSQYLIEQNSIQAYKTKAPSLNLKDTHTAILMGILNNDLQRVNLEFLFQEQNDGEDDDSENLQYMYLLLILVGVIILIFIVLLLIKNSRSKNNATQTNQIQVRNMQFTRQQIEDQRRIEKQIKKDKFIKKYKALIHKLMPSNYYCKYVEQYPLLKQQTECIICLLTFEEKDKCRFTLCGHLFHVQCFEEWVLKNLNCPFCREDFGPRALMKIYKSRKEGTFDDLNDDEKKESNYVKRLKGMIPDEEEEKDNDMYQLELLNNSIDKQTNQQLEVLEEGEEQDKQGQDDENNFTNNDGVSRHDLDGTASQYSRQLPNNLGRRMRRDPSNSHLQPGNKEINMQQSQFQGSQSNLEQQAQQYLSQENASQGNILPNKSSVSQNLNINLNPSSTFQRQQSQISQQYTNPNSPQKSFLNKQVHQSIDSQSEFKKNSIFNKQNIDLKESIITNNDSKLINLNQNQNDKNINLNNNPQIQTQQSLFSTNNSPNKMQKDKKAPKINNHDPFSERGLKDGENDHQEGYKTQDIQPSDVTVKESITDRNLDQQQ